MAGQTLSLQLNIAAGVSGRDQVKDLAAQIRAVGTGSGQSSPEAAKLADTLDNLAGRSENTSNSLKRLGAAIVAAFAVDRIVAAGQAVLTTSSQFDRINAVLEVAGGNAEAAAQGLEFVRDVAQRLGLEITSTADAYGKFAVATKGTALEGAEAQRIFEAVAGAVARTGGSADDAQGALTALAQMIGKGTVQAEELRGQLGERLPGAFAAAARAMGVSTEELGRLLEAGDVLATDMLPRLATELDRTFGAGAVNTLQANLNRLATSWAEFKAAAGETVGVKAGIEAVVGAVDWLRDSIAAAGDVQEQSAAQLQAMHDALVRLKGGVEAGGAAAEAYGAKLAAVDAALARVAKSSEAAAAEAPLKAVLPGLTSDADVLIAKFDALRKSGKDVAAALAEIGKSLNPGDTASIAAYGQALEELRLTGKITGQELETALGKALSGLDPAALAQFTAGLKDAFGEGMRDVQAFAALLDAALAESFKRLGLDAEQALGGIGKPIRDGIDSIHALTAALQAAETDAKTAGAAIAQGLEAITARAETRAEIEAIRTEITRLGEEGTLSTRQLAEANAELANRLREVDAAEVAHNAALQAAISAQNEAVAAAERHAQAVTAANQGRVDQARLTYEAAQALGDEAAAAQALIALRVEEAAQAQAVADAKRQVADAARDKVAAIEAEIQADQKLTAAEAEVLRTAQDAAAAKSTEAQAAATNAQSKQIEVAAAQQQAQATKDGAAASREQADAQGAANREAETTIALNIQGAQAQAQYNEIIRGGSDAWTQYRAAMKLAQDQQAQQGAADALAKQLEDATRTGEGLVAALQRAGVNTENLAASAADAASGFDLLDKQQLSGLQAAIEAAKAKLEAMRKEAADLVESIAQQLAQINPFDPENFARAYRNTIDEVGKKLQAAQLAGDAQTQRSLIEAYRLAGQLYRAQLDQAAKHFRDALVEADTKAREAIQAYRASIDQINADRMAANADLEDRLRSLREMDLSESEKRLIHIQDAAKTIQEAQKAVRAGAYETAAALRDQLVKLSEMGKAANPEDKAAAIRMLENAIKINNQIANGKARQLRDETQAKLEALANEEQVALAGARKVHEYQMAAIRAEAEASLRAAKARVGVIGRQSGGPVPGFATGGDVGRVPGTGTGDIVPAMLEPGEYVIRKAAVRKYGDAFMSRLNSGLIDLPKFAIGGLVGGMVSARPTASAPAPADLVVTLKVGGAEATGRFPHDSAADALVRELKRAGAVR